MADWESIVRQHGPLAFRVAWRILGHAADAEDVVQETFLRAHRLLADGGEIREPKAFLTEVTTRLAIDHLRSARVRRERYVGAWLPEPLVGGDEPSPEERAEDLESLSMAFLVVLETLSPVERAVFLLHDVFGFDFEEVAETVEKSPANTRQIAVRARQAHRVAAAALRALPRAEAGACRPVLRGAPARGHGRSRRDAYGRRDDGRGRWWAWRAA